MSTLPPGVLDRMADHAQQMTGLFERIAAWMAEHGDALNSWQRHHPAPLSIDGQAYRRRTKTRTRRNR